MILLVLSIFALLLWAMISTKDKKLVNLCEFNRNATSKLQVILAFLIVLAHLSQSLHVSYLRPFTSCGGFSVGLFFFISGYGLMQSLLSKENYLHGFLKKRYLKVLLPFFLATILYLGILFINGANIRGVSVRDMAWNLFVLPYSWFVKQIIFLYFIFWVVFKLTRHKLVYGCIVVSVLIVSYTLWLYSQNATAMTYLSTNCFSLGLWIALNDKQLGNLLKKFSPIKTYSIIIVSLPIIYFAPSILARMLICITVYILVRIAPILKCRIILLVNYVISHLGLDKNSYEIYLCQGVAYLCLRNRYIYVSANPIYICLSIVLIYVISGGVNKISVLINRKIKHI